MLAFFRRVLSSWVVLALLALLMLAFVVTGVDTPGFGGGGGGDAVATVGGDRIDAADVQARATPALQQARQQRPDLDMAGFVNAGGLGPVIDQLIDTRAMERWAAKQGIVASKRLVDGEIASVPAFAGPTGKFDEAAMRNALARAQITEAQLRRDATGDLVRRQLLVPLVSGARVGAGVAVPYASLLLEQRTGMIGSVPAAALPPGPAPTEAEIAAAYRQNIARYTVPERRTIRYAVFGPETVTAAARPSEAEIAAAYKADAAKYAASEQRTLQQAILPDQAAARALAAKVKSGTAFAAAAEAAGFGAADIAVPSEDRAAFAGASSPAVADAAYALPTGGTSEPVRTELGWHVVHVVSIRQVAGRTLAQARGEIEATLAAAKAQELATALSGRLEDALADGATFDEAATREKLTVATTPAILPDGSAPDQPGYVLPPEIAPLLRPAFQVSADDEPTVEALGPQSRRSALFALGRIVPATPRPLAAVRAQVAAELSQRKASDRAKAVASAIVAKVNRGVPMARSVAEAKLGLSAPQPITLRRGDIAQRGQVSPPLALLFTLGTGRAQLLPLPGNQGFYVVQAQRIVRGDAAREAGLVANTRRELAQLMSEELLQQLSTATKQAVGVKRNDAAIRRLRQDLAGNAPAAQ